MSKAQAGAPKPTQFKGHLDRVWSICIAGEAESQVLYTGSEDGTICSWNIETCEMKKEYKAHTGPVSCIFVFDDNLLSASADRTVIHWNLAGEIQKKYTAFQDSVRSVACSGETMAAGGVDGTLKLFTLGGEGGAPTTDVEAHNDVISCVAFSTHEEAGAQLFTGSYDKTVKSWDPATGAKAQVFSGHTNHVKSIAFGAGGATLYSGSRDETVRMWNVQDGRPLVVLQMPYLVNTIAVHANNLYCGFSDGKVRVILNKEIQAGVAGFKKDNAALFAKQKKEMEAKLEKQIKKMKKQMQKKIKEMQPAPAEEGGDKPEGEEGEEEAAAEDAPAEGEGDEAKAAELQEKMQQEVDQQAEQMRRHLTLKLAEMSKVRDRQLVVSPNLLKDGQSNLVKVLPYEGPSVLSLCVADKNMFLAADNEVIKATSVLSLLNI